MADSESQAAQPPTAPGTPEVVADRVVHEHIREAIEEGWYLKEISFRPTPTSEPRKYKIITQNLNG